MNFAMHELVSNLNNEAFEKMPLREQLEFSQKFLFALSSEPASSQMLAGAISLNPSVEIFLSKIVGHGVAIESPQLSKILDWIYLDASQDTPNLFSDLVIGNALHTSNVVSTKVLSSALKDNSFIGLSPKLFSKEGSPKYNIPAFYFFYEHSCITSLKSKIFETPQSFREEFEHYKKHLDPESYDDLKDTFQTYMRINHVGVHEPSFEIVFEGTNEEDVFTNRFLEVIKDIDEPSIETESIDFVCKAVDKLFEHFRVANITNHHFLALLEMSIDPEGPESASNSADFSFSPYSHFMKKAVEEGVSVYPLYERILGLSEESSLESVVEEMASRLPSTSKSNYIKRRDMWFGAFIMTIPTESLAKLTLSPESWVKIYMLKDDDKIKKKLEGSDHLGDILAYDLGL